MNLGIGQGLFEWVTFINIKHRKQLADVVNYLVVDTTIVNINELPAVAFKTSLTAQHCSD